MDGDLTRGNPAKVIVIYALPIILGNVFQQLYNVVDLIIVGRFISYQALAGVGITNGLTFFILGFVMGITSGMAIRTAQLVGAGDLNGMRRSVATSLLLCLASCVVLTVFSVLLARPLLRLIGTGEEIFGFASTYLIIIYAGVSTQIAYNMISCILRALGDSRTPLYFLIFSSLLNIVIDLLFIVIFDMGVKGAAYGTVISQGLSALLCFIYAFWKYPYLRLSRKDFNTSASFIWEHLRIGLPMAFQMSIIAIGIVLLQAALNAFPSTYIAGFTAANKIQNFGSLIAVSMGVAIANFVGQNYGAGYMSRVREGVRVTLIITLSACVVISILMVVLSRPLTSLFLTSGDVAGAVSLDEIYTASGKYLLTSAIFFPFLFELFIYRNALQGVGKTFWTLMAGILELVIRCATSFTLPVLFGYTGLIFVDVLAWVGAGLLQLVAYYKVLPKLKPCTL